MNNKKLLNDYFLVEREEEGYHSHMEEKPEEQALSPYCPAYSQAIEIIGRRWSGAIVRSLLAGKSRFGELAEAIPGLSDRLLSERLKELECQGIVARKVLPTTPVKIEYTLTEKGLALGGVVRAVNDWATEWAAEPSGADGVPSEEAASAS